MRFGLALLVLLSPSIAQAGPLVWILDDGDKVLRDQPATFASGADSPVWSRGQPVRLFAMRNETVAFQVVVSADDARASVTVDLSPLATEGGAKIENAPGANDPTSYVGRPVERFVEHFFEIARASGGRVPGESLGWVAGAAPTPPWIGFVPDALVPVEVAPRWCPYPMQIAAHRNGVVWIDVTIAKTQPPGLYRGYVEVKDGSESLAAVPVELTVVDAVLPDRPLRTMAYYDREELARRIPDARAAEEHLWKLFHRHRVAPLHGALDVEGAEHHLPALDGSIYTAAHGYEGPAEKMGDGILSLGTYGTLRTPDDAKLRKVEAIADWVAGKSLFDDADVFVYAIDEQCDSPNGREWKRLLAGSTNANAKRLRVGWTCSEEPATQPVDIVMVHETFDPARTAAARAIGKEVWVYNGREPFMGTFFTDAPAVEPRVNGWLGAMFDVGRWFVWETTFWDDDNRGGKGSYDPFVTPETFHNQDDDYCMGDGVLVYPGTQIDRFAAHSMGMNGIVASIRLKNWRRGIEDAGYYQMAHAADPARAEAIASALLPRVFSAASVGAPASWSHSGKAFFEARKALLDLIPRGTDGGAGIGAKPSHGTISPAARTRPFEKLGAPRKKHGRVSGTIVIALGAAIAIAAGIAISAVRRARRSRLRTYPVDRNNRP